MLHAWDLQDFVLHVLRNDSYQMAHATTIAQNMTQMEIVWLHVLQDFINLQTQYAVYVDQIARNATAQLHARNVRQTFTLI